MDASQGCKLSVALNREASMAQVHLVDDARATAVRMELDGATPIRPLRAVLLQFPAPQATDEWEIPSAPLSLAVRPEAAELGRR